MINKLYQEVLLEHNRSPHHFGQPDLYCCQGRAYNPTCGDDLDVYFIEQSPRVQGVYFTGEACAVATASASLMSQVMDGLSAVQAVQLCESFINAVEQGSKLEARSALMRPLQALLAVRNFPGRHGCATLPWKAALQILKAQNSLAVSA